MARIPAYLLIRRKSDSSPVRYATAGRIGRRRGGERRCLSKRQALEPSMLRRGGLRETTRDTRESVASFNVDETPIGVADGLSATRVVPALPGAVKIVQGADHSYREVLFRMCIVCACVYVCVRAVHSSVSLRRMRAYACVCARACACASRECR